MSNSQDFKKCTELCGCFPLAIYFTFGSVYKSMPLSYYVPAYPWMPFSMTILEAAGTAILLREETYYLGKYSEKPFGLNETCGHRYQQEARTRE